MTRCLVGVSERCSASADAYAGDRPSFPRWWSRKQAADVCVKYSVKFLWGRRSNRESELILKSETKNIGGAGKYAVIEPVALDFPWLDLSVE